jgi:hypothetical protein
MMTRNAYRKLVGEPEEKTPLERLRSRWAGLREIGCGAMDWIDLVQDKNWWRDPVNMVKNWWLLKKGSHP